MNWFKKFWMPFVLLLILTSVFSCHMQWAKAAVIPYPRPTPIEPAKPIPLDTLSLGALVGMADGGDKQARTFLMGLWGGISWTNLYVDIVQHQKSVYCPPKDKVFDDKVVMGIMTKGLDDCIECKEERAALGILSLMLKEFPCDDGENVDGYESEENIPPVPLIKD